MKLAEKNSGRISIGGSTLIIRQAFSKINLEDANDYTVKVNNIQMGDLQNKGSIYRFWSNQTCLSTKCAFEWVQRIQNIMIYIDKIKPKAISCSELSKKNYLLYSWHYNLVHMYAVIMSSAYSKLHGNFVHYHTIYSEGDTMYVYITNKKFTDESIIGKI